MAKKKATATKEMVKKAENLYLADVPIPVIYDELMGLFECDLPTAWAAVDAVREEYDYRPCDGRPDSRATAHTLDEDYGYEEDEDEDEE